MTSPNPFRIGWAQIKHRGLAVIAAVLMHGGVYLIFSVLKYPLGYQLIKGINALLSQAFRDHVLLREPWSLPWSYYARTCAGGVIIVVVGMFLGLWATARSRRQASA